MIEAIHRVCDDRSLREIVRIGGISNVTVSLAEGTRHALLRGKCPSRRAVPRDCSHFMDDLTVRTRITGTHPVLHTVDSLLNAELLRGNFSLAVLIPGAAGSKFKRCLRVFRVIRV